MRSSAAFRGSLLMFLILFALGSSAGPASAAPASFYVGTAADESDGGECGNNTNTDCSLRDAIMAANDNANPADVDTIQFLVPGPFNLTLGSLSEGAQGLNDAVGDLDALESLLLDGTSQLVDASGLQECDEGCVPAPDRVVHVATPGQAQTNLTIEDLTLTGGDTTGDGGGVANYGSIVTLVRTVIDGNESDSRGGGVYGGTVASSATTTLNDSDVVDNSTEGEGGGLYNGEGDELNVVNGSQVQGNSADGDGGGIYNLGHTEVTTASIVGTDNPESFSDYNVADGEGGGIWTGAFFAPRTLILDGASVSSNLAGEHGGGIYNDGDRVEITDSTISFNMTGLTSVETAGLGGNGGGIWTSAVFDDTEDSPGLFVDEASTISENTANEQCDEGCQGGQGGGIWNHGHTEIAGLSDVDSNRAELEGGGIWTAPLENVETLLVEDSTVNDNAAGSDGGGIFNAGDRVEVDGSEVSGNVAGADSCFDGCLDGGNGGGIWTLAPSEGDDDDPGLYVTDSEILGNTAQACTGECGPDTGDGGGVWNAGHTEISEGSAVNDNIAEGNGGGMWTAMPSCNIVDCCPEGCGSLLLTDVGVRDNTAAGDGGGIWNDADLVELLRVTVDGNRAGVLVGEFCGGETCEPIEDVIGGSGGGIYSDNSLQVEAPGLFVSRSAITRNEAPGPPEMDADGGGGVWNGNAYADIFNSTVSENTTGGSGGGLYQLGSFDGLTDVRSSTIAFNETASGGGGIAVGENLLSPHVRLHNSIVSNSRNEAGNAPAPNCSEEQPGEIQSRGHNMSSDATCNLTQPSDKPSTDPMLLALALNPPGSTETNALPAGSPAIDAGAPTVATETTPACPNNDQRGVTRPQGAACDMGAYERAAQAPGGGGGGPPPPKPECSDGIDNDEDDLVDLQDPGCENADDDDETDPPPLPGCANGEDDDGDGLVDHLDPGCENALDDDETNEAAADCEIEGTPQADILVGTAASEVICGRGSDDVIRGGGGNDTLIGDSGNDLLNGGPGDDILNGGDGTDTADYSDNPTPIDADLKAGIVHGASTDTVSGVENVIGSPFPDRIAGSAGPNILKGKNSADRIVGRGGDDFVRGARGNDSVRGGKGNDILKTGHDRDTLRGGVGDDILTGGQKQDDLKGNKGDDRLRGGGADDHLDGNAGNDDCDGGYGSDVVVNCEP